MRIRETARFPHQLGRRRKWYRVCAFVQRASTAENGAGRHRDHSAAHGTIVDSFRPTVEGTWIHGRRKSRRRVRRPVMIAIDYDPLALHYVASLARPRGNVTGVFFQQVELAMKRLQLMKEILPSIEAATVFWNANSVAQWEATQRAGTALGLRLAGIELKEQPYDYEAALAKAAPQYRGALVVMTSTEFFFDRGRLANMALRDRIPTIFAFREWVEVGGLLSYGPNISAMYRLAADYVDRIVHGEKPAELPVQQPTKFDFVINLKTAKALGLNISSQMQLLADEVIE